jgi:negative elongation factor B
MAENSNTVAAAPAALQPLKMGLQALGLQNNQHLKTSLISCDDPLKAISDFQEENSIHLTTLKPALNLLDLHGLKRLDFHLSIAEELKENLVKRVEELATNIAKETSNTDDLKKLEDLLDKSFPLIKYVIRKDLNF